LGEDIVFLVEFVRIRSGLAFLFSEM